jgi:LuxR family transcriptional regulator, maltose regulon positive regulatory protein
VAATDVRQRTGQTRPGYVAAFDLVESKLRHPPAPPGTVPRSALIERLARDDSRPIVSVVAPAGHGKTTLLSQWADSGQLAFAWVSVDERDNDPKVLLTYVAAALNVVQPVDRRVFEALASPVSSVPGSVVPRLGRAFASMTVPVVLVLDDVHLLHDRECRAALSVLADHVPSGSRLVFAGRTAPPLRLARLRAEDRISEIGRGDLLLTSAEAASLLRDAEVTLGADDVAVLHQRTEGWPVGMYLAALYLREGGSLSGAAVSFGGDDQLVSQYIESEFLERISKRHRVFMTRTAVLDRMSGPLCEAVVELPGAVATLAELSRSNMLLVALDGHGEWYRYHHLFRDMLLAELERYEPDLIPVLQRRAASWYLGNDLPEEALEYFIAAGDVDAAAALVERLGVPTHRQGRFTTLRRWFGWLDNRGGIDGHPMAAVLAALFSAMTGRPVEADRWADAIDRWQYGDTARQATPFAEAHAAILRALMCRGGVDQVLADATDAVRRCAAEHIVTPAPALYQGLGQLLAGDPDGGDQSFSDAVSAGERAGAHETLAVALCERSVVGMTRGAWSQAEDLAGQARATLRRAGIEESYATPLVCVVHAQLALHREDAAAARQELTGAQRLRHLLTYAMPQLAVQVRIQLVDAHLRLDDLAGARTLMQEIEELLKRRPGLGTLAGEAAALRARLAQDRGRRIPGASALTAAELRLLPLLSTHLPIREIAAELSLSPHTIKSQMRSIYRKLDASTRTEAVNRARDLGLLDGLWPGLRPAARVRARLGRPPRPGPVRRPSRRRPAGRRVPARSRAESPGSGAASPGPR